MELWKTDGTAAGTILVKDIYTGYDRAGFPHASSPRDLTEFNGKLYFTADVSNTRHIWSSDGTEAGTKLTINYTLSNATGRPAQLQIYQNQLYFPASVNNLWRLHRSDGTQTSTVRYQLHFRA